jgi:hypothetical protein
MPLTTQKAAGRRIVKSHHAVARVSVCCDWYALIQVVPPSGV